MTVLLRALEYTNEEMLELFFDVDEVSLTKTTAKVKLVPERLRGQSLSFDVKGKDGEVVVAAGKRVTARHVKELEEAGITELSVPDEFLIGRTLARDTVDTSTGELVAEANAVIEAEQLEAIRAAGIKKLPLLYTNDVDRGAFVSDTLRVLLHGLFPGSTSSGLPPRGHTAPG